MKNVIQQRQTERFLLLYALYRKSNGLAAKACDMQELAGTEGIGGMPFRAAFDFLCEEGLIRMHSYGHSPFGGHYASLTAHGIGVLEAVFQDETEATAYFPSYREMVM